MKTSTIITFLLLAICQLVAFSQTNKASLLADIYQRASTFYEQDKFVECLTLLERAETLAGEPDAKILYLKVKSLYNLVQKDNKYLGTLEENFTFFFKTAYVQNFPNEKVTEIKEIKVGNILKQIYSEKEAIKSSPYFSGKINYEQKIVEFNGIPKTTNYEKYFYKNFSKIIYNRDSTTKSSDSHIVIYKDKIYTIDWSNKLYIEDYKISEKVKYKINTSKNDIIISGNQCSNLSVEGELKNN